MFGAQLICAKQLASSSKSDTTYVQSTVVFWGWFWRRRPCRSFHRKMTKRGVRRRGGGDSSAKSSLEAVRACLACFEVAVQRGRRTQKEAADDSMLGPAFPFNQGLRLRSSSRKSVRSVQEAAANPIHTFHLSTLDTSTVFCHFAISCSSGSTFSNALRPLLTLSRISSNSKRAA
jgi:hypothetical protein